MGVIIAVLGVFGFASYIGWQLTDGWPGAFIACCFVILGGWFANVTINNGYEKRRKS